MSQQSVRNEALEIFRQFENHFYEEDGVEEGVASIDEYTKWPNTNIDVGTVLFHAPEALFMLSVTDGSEGGIRTLLVLVGEEDDLNTVILRYEGVTQIIWKDGTFFYE